MSEVRFDTRESFALQVLSILDTNEATAVVQDGHEIVLLFDLSEEDLAERIYAAAETLGHPSSIAIS